MRIVGYVPPMYVAETICDNREKRQRSTRRNFERGIYESIERGDDTFGGMLDDEIRRIRQVNRDD